MLTKKLYFCLLASLTAIISCGSTTKSVQYVYVDKPVYDPAPEKTYNRASSNTEKPRIDYVDNRGHYETSSGTVASGGSISTRSTAPSTQNPQQSLWEIAKEPVPGGGIRAYGEFKSPDSSLADRTALNNAINQLAMLVASISLGDDDNQTSQTSSATVTVYGDGSSASGSTPFITKNEVVSCVKSYARARINNIKVVAAKRTPGPITRVEYVIEVNQNDIIDMLNPLMERLTVEERRALEESIKKGMQR